MLRIREAVTTRFLTFYIINNNLLDTFSSLQSFYFARFFDNVDCQHSIVVYIGAENIRKNQSDEIPEC